MTTCNSFGCPREREGHSILCAEHGASYRLVLAARQERSDIIDKYGMYTVETVTKYRDAA